MTLFRKLLMVILLSSFANLLGVLWLQFDNTRSYLENQLDSDLKNAVTALSIKLQPLLSSPSPDEVLIQSNIKAFAHGSFYQQIHIQIFANDHEIIETLPTHIEGVPSWFIELDLIAAKTQTEVITGSWMQLAKLTIVGHSGFAYKQLWLTFIEMSFLLGMLSIGLILLAALGVKKVLKPLRLITEKAQQIQDRKFGQLLPLSNTLELAAVTDAINKMTTKLRAQFAEEARLHNKLKEQAFQDTTTGFGNRAFFNRQLQAWLDEGNQGVVAFIELLGLDDINKKSGWAVRDDTVKSVAHFIENSFTERAGIVKCRLSVNEFAVIIDKVSFDNAAHVFEPLIEQLSNSHFQNVFCQPAVFNIGAVHISQQTNCNEVLTLADQAMHQARYENIPFKVIQQSTDEATHFARSDIKQVIEEAIEQSSLSFVRQPVMEVEQGEIIHYEAFARLQIDNAQQINAATFISVLDEFEMGTEFDQKVIELLIAHISHGSDKKYAINLTASALKNSDFIDWLTQQLVKFEKPLQQVCFEFSEESVIYNRQNIEYLCKRFQQHNIAFGVDRVGRNFSSLAYLQSIHPTYVKIDHAFTQMALNSNDDAYFVGSLCTTIHNLDIKVIATRVETQAQLALLREYHFDAYQGYICKPESFKITSIK